MFLPLARRVDGDEIATLCAFTFQVLRSCERNYDDTIHKKLSSFRIKNHTNSLITFIIYQFQLEGVDSCNCIKKSIAAVTVTVS